MRRVFFGASVGCGTRVGTVVDATLSGSGLLCAGFPWVGTHDYLHLSASRMRLGTRATPWAIGIAPSDETVRECEGTITSLFVCRDSTYNISRGVGSRLNPMRRKMLFHLCFKPVRRWFVLKLETLNFEFACRVRPFA